MDPSRKRKIRLVVALAAALLLAGALAYTSFSASSEDKTPSQLASGAQPGRSYELTGKVAAGTGPHGGGALVFRVRRRSGNPWVPVPYAAAVPGSLREAHKVIVVVR